MNAVISEKDRNPESDKPQSKTDWNRLKNMTDADIDKAIQDDPDAPPAQTEESLKRYVMRPPRIKRDAKR